jgi:hypothetical protein
MDLNFVTEYVTQAELAARLDKSTRTLKRWQAHRYGPQPIRIGKSLHYRTADVLAWLAAQPPATYSDTFSGGQASHKPRVLKGA